MTNSKPTRVAEATGTDPRLEIIADVLRGLIPGAVPANLTVHIEEQLPAGRNHSWVGPVEAISAKILDVLVALTLAVADEHGSTADDVVIAADEAGCLAGHSRDACETAAQAAEDLIAAHLAQNGATR